MYNFYVKVNTLEHIKNKFFMSDIFSISNEELACVKKPNEPLGAKSKEEFEQMIKAIAKSKRDIVWWAEHFFRIVSLNTGLSIIKLYEKQRQMLYHLVNHDRNIVLAARQTGKCVHKDTTITVRNKKTGNVEKLTVEEFYNRLKQA